MKLVGLVLLLILLVGLTTAAIGTLGWLLGGSAVVAALIYYFATRSPGAHPSTPEPESEWQPKPRTRDPDAH